MDEKKRDLIVRITEIELRMFLTVSARERASCQEHPEEFKRNREAQFSTWSENTLKSYLNDLILAEAEKRNLMTLKYGRMQNILPGLNSDPLIEKIVNIQYMWQKKMFEKYPKMMSGARAIDKSEDNAVHTSFETYLRGELETYSGETLRLLYEDMEEYLRKKKNMNEALYTHFVQSLGYQTIEEVENSK